MSTPRLHGKGAVDRAAESWLLPGEQVGREYRTSSRTRMVEVVRRSRVVRVLELAGTKRGWLPETVTACGAAILRGPDAAIGCPPTVASAEGLQYRQIPVRRGPQLGIAAPIMLLRVTTCGVLLPGRRVLALAADVWPVTSYTRSEESPVAGQVISIAVGRGLDQQCFLTEYEGTR